MTFKLRLQACTWRPGELRDSRGCTGQPPRWRITQPHIPSVPRWQNPVVNHGFSPLGCVSRFVTTRSWHAALIGVCPGATVSFMRAAAVALVHAGSSAPGTTLLSFTGPGTTCWAVCFPLFLVKNILIFLWAKTSALHLVSVGASVTVLWAYDPR